jgi:hypothetical protein
MTATWNGHATCHHRAYRITCEQYDRMLDRADGHCEICGLAVEDTPDGRLGIDHDHRAGDGFNHVRGMLCTKCNCNLKYPERGDRPYTDAEAAYMARAWCVLEPPPAAPAPKPPVPLVRMTLQVPQGMQENIRQLVAWHLRVPGAKRPERPSSD